MKKIANFLIVEKENDIYTIRMSAELQDDVGTIGFIEFTEEEVLKVDDIILNLEASKTVMGVTTPLAGRIVEKNNAASLTPTLLNSEKPEENWLVKLTDVNQDEFDALENE